MIRFDHIEDCWQSYVYANAEWQNIDTKMARKLFDRGYRLSLR